VLHSSIAGRQWLKNFNDFFVQNLLQGWPHKYNFKYVVSSGSSLGKFTRKIMLHPFDINAPRFSSNKVETEI